MAGIPLRRFLHWGPITALVIIKLIIWSMVHILPMYWNPYGSMAGFIHAACFMVFACATLYYFLQSLLEGPGYVPLGWKPVNEQDTNYLQYCTVCNGYKAPRSHHCRKCGRCVLKMDHHCPWINSCVGHANHAYFNMFLLCAVFGCLQASIVLSVSMYHAINRVWYVHHGISDRPMIYLTLTTLVLLLLAVGMALGVVLAVGALLYMQIKGILRNRTSIEDWILEKAESRREEARLPPFVYPYDKGWRENLDNVFNSTTDGIEWPLREGCGKYDLTSEQIAQKSYKRARSRQLTCVSSYSGRWVPLLSWPRAAAAAPCSDEPRLPLRPGDRVRVTRQRTHWLFGEKLAPSGGGEARGLRGWFPRDAVVPTDELTSKSE